MFKPIHIIGIAMFFILSLFSFVFSQESMTITTYYPSPYGSYNELTTTGNTYLATTSGNVGIGTTTPGQKLEVNGRIRMDLWSADGNIVVYKNASGDIGVQSSDVRMKKNITKIENPLDVVLALNGIKFNWVNEPDNAQKKLGVIAQDVQKVLPEAVFTSKNEKGEEYLGVHYEKLPVVIIEAVKAQQQEIQALKQEVDRLSKKVYSSKE